MPRRPDKIRLSLIGCGALLLLADYQRGTKDSDVFENTDLREETGIPFSFRWEIAAP